MKKIISVITVLALLFGFAACGKKPVEKTGGLAVLPTFKTTEKEILVFDRGNTNAAEYIMLTSLQGITAQKDARVFLKDNDNMVYLEDGVREKNMTVKEFSDIWELIKACREDIKDSGCVIFKENDDSVNMAATVSGAEGWLMVPETLRERAEAEGFTVKRDLTADGSTYESIFNEYKDKLNNNLLIHQAPGCITLRDYGIAAKAFCFYTAEKDKASFKFRNSVFAWAKQNAPVFGWSSDEGGYVEHASENGLFILASDHCTNVSFLSGWDTDSEPKQKVQPEKITADESKHYIALVMSDGDNVQWFETTVPFRGHFYERTQNPKDYKLTWTAPPLLQTLAPSSLQHIYNIATDKDRFVAGVSGCGYINPSSYPKNFLDDFVKQTADTMKDADLQNLAVLEVTKSTGKIQKSMSVYADIGGFDGGLMQVENKYEALKGKIVWCGDKPFISARRSFWYTSNIENEMANREWVEEFAKQLNALPADIHSEDGYSYINVHPWSTTMDDLNYLVSLLDGHIELVYADELIELVKENVKH